MNLTELQTAFQDYLMDDKLSEVNAKHEFQQQIIDDKKVGVYKRLNIYHHGYRARLIEALATTYEKVYQWLGDEIFERVALSYIKQFPSQHRNMRWVGSELHQVLTEHLSDKDSIAADLATFEWALSLAFDAADEDVLSIQDLAAIPPEEWGSLSFQWHPSVQQHAADDNVIAIWQALEADQTPKTDSSAIEYLVWRKEMMSHFKSLDTTETAAIKLMMQGNTFGDLCEMLTAEVGEEQAVNQGASYLAEWLNEGMLTAINRQP